MPELLERERAMREVEGAVAALRRGRGGVVLVQGPPGSGRTAVVEAAAGVARRAGSTVRSWTAVDDEAGLALSTADALLAGAATPADLLAAAAEDAAGSLTLLADDVERADPASLALLGAVARRVGGAPLLLVLATDDGEAGRPVRRALAGVRHLDEIVVGPLSPEGSAALVRAHAPHLDAAAAVACHDAAAGLPRYLMQLAAHRGDGSPPALVRDVGDRLAALGEAPSALAVALAILGAGAEWSLAGRIAGVPGPRRRAGADALRAAGILDRGAAPAFTAPALAAAVREAAPPGAVATAHRRAAELLAAEQVPPERVAEHLLAAEPDADEWVCRTLKDAARRAMDRHAPEAAIVLLERALAEPPPPVDRAALLIDLGAAETVAFRTAAAVAHLRAAVAAAGSLEERLQASLGLVAVLTHTGDPEGDLAAVLSALGDLGDPRTRGQLEAHLINQTRQRTSLHRATRGLAEAVAARATADVAAASAPELAVAAAELTMAGVRCDDAARFAAAALERAPDPEPMRSTTVPVAIRCLAASDHLHEAAAFVDAALADGRARNAALEVMMLSAFRGDVALRAGDLAQAEQLSRAAWDAGRREEWELGRPAITAGLVDALRERGALAEAQEVLRVSGFAHPAELGHDLYTAAMLLYSRGRLLLALGATAAGVADLRDAGRRLDLHLEPNPALVPWRSALAVAVGGREGAALARDELRIARTFGAPRAIGIALRATAMLEGGTARAARLREAAEVLRRSPARLEHARVLADLGEALLQDGRRADARDVLREAYELAHVCGADALTTQAASALRTTGARPRRPFRQGPGSLTARERRVADLAADGLTNRGIADALVVTVSTVEFHLASTYRKLGIASRRELAGVLRGGSEGMGDGPDRVAAHATDR